MSTNLPEGLKIRRGILSPVWLTPLLALCITLWLLYSGYVNLGKEIIIQFDSGSELVPEKTPVKYRGINVGKVKDVRIAESPDKVEAVVMLSKEAEILAREGMMFWIVKPRLGFNKITGLETLISGSYIEVQPPTFDMEKMSELAEQTYFIGLSEPPDTDLSEDALTLRLQTKSNQYLIKGVPVFFKGMNAGQVTGVKFDPKSGIYDVNISVNRDYKQYVTTSTAFWDVGGLELKFDAAGLSLESAPLASLISGGVSFDNPSGEPGAPVENGHLFSLYGSEEQSRLSENVITLRMKNSGGIKAGRTPVMFMGLPAGLVTDVSPSADYSEVNAHIRLNREYESFAGKDSRFVLVKPSFSVTGISGLSTVLTGVYIEVYPGGGEPASEFALSEYAPAKGETDGRRITLSASDKGSLDVMSGIYFRNIQIGHITDVRLIKNRSVEFDAVIYSGYANLAGEGLYFSRKEGLDLRLDSTGLTIDTPSLTALIRGGIEAEHFGRGTSSLNLYESSAEAKKAYYKDTGIKTVRLAAGTAEELAAGDALYFRGIKVGEIGGFSLNKSGSGILAEAFIYPEYTELVTPYSIFYKSGGISFEADAAGLRIQAPALKTAIGGGIAFFNPQERLLRCDNNTYTLFESRSDGEKAIALSGSGRSVTLTAANAVPPAEGADVYYRNMNAGTVTGVKPGRNGIPELTLFIKPEFARFLSDKTRFWLEGGMEFRADTSGFSFKSKPVKTYIEDAVYFDNFKKNSGTGVLYPDPKSAREADMAKIYVSFPYQVEIKRGAPLMSGKAEAGYAAGSVIKDGKTRTALLVHDEFTDGLTEGALFWTEGMKISADGIENLDSAVLGTKIAMKGGSGEAKTEFTALAEAPSPFEGKEGLRIRLLTPARHSLERGSPVYYRQMETGGVENIRLSADGRNVEVSVFIDEKYRRLVKNNSVFWNSGGVGTKINLFGVKVKTESLKTLLAGGISFATPDETGAQAENGEVFNLYADPKSSWLNWEPDLSETADKNN
ncbi:PqiB family protein [Geovibrio thiophilus]|nr:MlaD family protein [Geovibrio thiophilus]